MMIKKMVDMLGKVYEDYESVVWVCAVVLTLIGVVVVTIFN